LLVFQGASPALLVLDAQSLGVQAQVTLSGQPLLDVLYDGLTGRAYVPVRTSGGDRIDQIDVAAGTVRQSLALSGTLLPPLGPRLAAGGDALVVPEAVGSAPDQVEEIYLLGTLAPTSVAHLLPGELDAGLDTASSAGGTLLAVLSRP